MCLSVEESFYGPAPRLYCKMEAQFRSNWKRIFQASRSKRLGKCDLTELRRLHSLVMGSELLDVARRRRSFRLSLSFAAVLLAALLSVSGVRIARAETTRLSDSFAELPFEGYVFVDGKYLAAPYHVRTYRDKIVINDREFSPEYLGISSDELPEESVTEFPPVRRRGFGPMGRVRRDHFGDGYGSRRDAGSDNRFDPISHLGDSLSDVKNGAVVILFEKERPVILHPSSGGKEILGALTGVEYSQSGKPSSLSDRESEVWDRLTKEFKGNDKFAARAIADIQRTEAAIQEGERAMYANQIVTQITYPLTLFAMLSVVLGFGHLLSYRPSNAVSEGETGTEAKKLITKTIAVIALLSIVDLVWTLAATNAGTMRELNPLGSQFVNNPWLLGLFKVFVTGGALAILYRYYQRSFAQVAAWWCCLVLVLLTSRWIIFQSMFV